MYNATAIKDGMLGLVGWGQNYDGDGVQVESDLLVSRSGILFNDQHPLLTIDNLISAAPDFDRVFSTPAEVETAFNNWLREGTKGAIVLAVDDWIRRKASVQTAKSLIEREQLFKTTGRIGYLDAVGSSFVGVEAKVERSRSTVAKISEIGLRFNKAHTRTIRLFKSDQPEEVDSIEVVYDEANKEQWVEVDWEMSGDGAYYIAYDQSEESDAQSLNGVVDYNWEDQGLVRYPVAKYMVISAFKVESDGSELWDVSDNTYTSGTNYGINLRYSVRCDFTDFILDQADYFKTIIAKSVAVYFLRKIAFNPEANENRHNANVNRQEVLYEIDGDSQGRDKGIGKSYNEALDLMTVDVFEGIDKVCLPCMRRGVDYSST